MILRRLLAILLCLGLAVPAYGATQEKYVALTFDDGPSGRFTRALLDGLEKRNVKATFLLCGYRLKDYPREAGRIHAEGHEIGLHGYSHSCMADMCQEELERELADTMALLPEGCKPAFLRPPGGKCSEAVLSAARQADLGVLSWSVDPKDWASHDAQVIGQTVVQTVRDGDVILLHDMSDSSVEAALSIVDELKAQGFRFVTVSELARLKGVAIQPGKVYQRF
ncbi:MAG: polysaccharide deacetylase family protein [Oscillospiraceae bacterium]|nr:polysaccharide deacetylase family protein [Oscillospiraceae bacterium]